LRKELWLDGCLADESRRVGFALPEGLCDLGGGSFSIKASMIGDRSAPLQLYPGICLTTEKKHGKPQNSRLLSDSIRCVELAEFLGAASPGLLRIDLPWLIVRDFRQHLEGTNAFKFCRTKRLPASAKIESKLSVNARMWRRRMESLNPREFPCS
jgi:hypothetical protein